MIPRPDAEEQPGQQLCGGQRPGEAEPGSESRQAKPLAHDEAQHVLTPGDTYTSPLLPGLEIPLAEVLPS